MQAAATGDTAAVYARISLDRLGDAAGVERQVQDARELAVTQSDDGADQALSCLG